MDDYCALRQRLLARLAQIECRLHKIETDRQRATNPPTPDWAEQAAIRQNDAVLDKLAEDVHQQIVAIRAALTRIAQGTYGICRTCEEPIAPQRLAVLPYASRYLACATQVEQGARHRR